MVRQKAILDLALQFDNACTAKHDLRKAYEKCNDISQESRALIDTFLKEESDKDYELNLSILDIDDSDLRLTPVLRPSSSTRVETSSSTQNPVRIIPGPAGIVQASKLLKQRDILLGLDRAVMSTQEYMKKVVEDVGEDEDFRVGRGSKLKYKFQDQENSEDIFSFGRALEDFICVAFVPDRSIVRYPYFSFLVDVLAYFHINLSQLSVNAAAKNDSFFRVDSSVFSLSIPWHTKKTLTKDPSPTAAEFSAEACDFLATHQAPFQKFPELFLYLVGISCYYDLDDNVYPTFLTAIREEMDLFTFIRHVVSFPLLMKMIMVIESRTLRAINEGRRWLAVADMPKEQEIKEKLLVFLVVLYPPPKNLKEEPRGTSGDSVQVPREIPLSRFKGFT
ncbi:hypothetical protein Tco_0189142 [Tanacetum coccineum]